jgi:predicted ribosomally synthesized peptide with nif11-like leader
MQNRPLYDIHKALGIKSVKEPWIEPMTRASALAFFEKVKSDRAMQARMERMPQKNIKSLLRFAADAGYFFSPKDYQAALEVGGELSDKARALLAQGYYVIPGLTVPADQRQ